MKQRLARFAAAFVILACARAAYAQTVDDIIEKTITATGGRAAYAKLKSRRSTGTMTLITPAGDIEGTVEIFNAAPNKARTLIKADLTALGAGPLTFDQRFNGTTGYTLDSLQGDREITGNQLDNMRNTAFPNGLLNYKQLGIVAKLVGKEKVGDRDVYLVTFEPTTGSVVRQYIDAETFLPLRAVVKVAVPQLGGQEIEQTTQLLDYRDVDGVKLPFRIESSSSIQSFTITLKTVEHNVPMDEALFSKPGDK